MSELFLTRCDNCGWAGRLALGSACPSCGAKGTGLTDQATQRLHSLDQSMVERINSRRGKPVRVKTLASDSVQTIPVRLSRTRQAAEARRVQKERNLSLVMAMTAQGKSAAVIGVKLGIGPRHVRGLRAEAKKRSQHCPPPDTQP